MESRGLRNLQKGYLYLFVASLLAVAASLTPAVGGGFLGEHISTVVALLYITSLLLSLYAVLGKIRSGYRDLAAVSRRFRAPYLGANMILVGLVLMAASVLINLAGDRLPPTIPSLLIFSTLGVAAFIAFLVGGVLVFIVGPAKLYRRYGNPLHLAASASFILAVVTYAVLRLQGLDNLAVFILPLPFAIAYAAVRSTLNYYGWHYAPRIPAKKIAAWVLLALVVIYAAVKGVEDVQRLLERAPPPTWPITTRDIATTVVLTQTTPERYVITIPVVNAYTTTPEATTTRIVTTWQSPLQRDNATAFILGFVERLNEVRRQYGIPPVKLMHLSVADFKAEYMARNNYLSHYDKEGRHPIYYYTKLDGGHYAVEENGYACHGSCNIDYNHGRRMADEMIFNDELSLWGHRDSLLDPCNNYVAVGVARGGSGIYAAAYMVGKWVEWEAPPRYENGVFYARGYVELPPDLYGIHYSVYIYKAEIDPANYEKHSYDIGYLYAVVVPPNAPYYYPNTKEIRADTYRVEKTSRGWLFEIRFRFTPPDNALYTIVAISAPTGVKWEPKSPLGSYRLQRCKIISYTIGR